MIFRKTKIDVNSNYKLDDLESELKRMVEEIESGNLNVRCNVENIAYKEVVNNINRILNSAVSLAYDRNNEEKNDNKTQNYSQELQKENEQLSVENNKLKLRLSIAAKMAKIGLWDMDVVSEDLLNPDNVFVWSNEFRHMLGFSDEEDFPNKLSSWSSRLHPDDSKSVSDAFVNHIKDYSGKTPYSLDYRLKMKSGEYRWFHAEGNTTRDNSGAPLTVLGSIVDITRIKVKETKSIELTKRMEEFTQAINEIVKSVDSIAMTAQELAESQENTMKASEKIKESTDETQKITEFLKEIANQTNLLGLNAAIEAARSGKEGLGFSVVANEIRDLSLNSSDAVEKIEKSIDGMNDSVIRIIKNIEDVNSIAQTQASTTEEVNASVEELNASAEELLKTANEIIM